MFNRTLALLAVFLFSSVSHAAILKAYASGNETFYSFNPSTANLSLITNTGSYAMDFSPDGILYGVDRAADAFYRINESGTRTWLGGVGYDDWGGGFTVSNDGEYAYWTNRTSSGTTAGYPTLLYRKQLSGGPIESLGIVNGLLSVSDIEFGIDGTLYAMSGMSHGCSAPDRALYSIDLNTMSSTKLSADYLGMNVDCRTIITALNSTDDGTMHMIAKPQDGTNSYYMGTIDLSTGQGTINYNKRITLNGAAYTAGLEVAFYSAVPVPATVWLFGSALITLLAVKRKA